MSKRDLSVPVFAAVGAGAWGPVQELRGCPELRLVDTPRHAAVLLVAGRIPAAHAEALDRVHDQVPHPRAAVAWSDGAGDAPAPAAVTVAGGRHELVAAVVDAFDRVVDDPSMSTPDRLRHEEPNPWRGVGPFGQGGEGMMGGTPYGRPMAMTGDDRDGVALDQLHLRLGPFLPWLPPGVVLEVTLQGEVLQSATAQLAAQDGEDAGGPLSDAGADQPGRAGLRWLAHALHVHGLDALAARAARLAGTSAESSGRFDRLHRSVRRSGLLWSTRGVGSIDGFGDASERWEGRLAGIADELATGRRAEPDAALSWSELAEALSGMTLADAVTTVVSLHGRIAAQHSERAAS